MSVSITEPMYGRQEFESSPERMMTGMPDVNVAIAEMEQRRGELFCNFSKYGIDIGMIALDGPVLGFRETQFGNDARSGYVVIKHGGAIHYDLGNSGRFGAPIDHLPPVQVFDDIQRSIGTTECHFPASPGMNGPVVVEVSDEPRNTAGYDVARDSLVIGTRVVGAFAIGKTIKELTVEPKNIDISMGLLIAAHLEKSGADWKPDMVGDKSTDSFINDLKSRYMNDALIPAVLRELNLVGGWHAYVNPIGNRLPLFALNLTEAREILHAGIEERIEIDEAVKGKYDQRKRDHGSFGDLQTYMAAEVDNYLINRLGLTD